MAFIAIVRDSGSWWPWSVVVHESGTRTLGGTVLYFEHALRELPLDLVLGVAIGGAVVFVVPRPPLHRRGLAMAAVFGLLAMSALIVLGSAAAVGWRGVATNLAQAPLRVGSPEVWGQHWQYHLLSRLALLLLTPPFAVLALGRTSRPEETVGPRALWIAAGAFAIGTLLFRPTIRSFTDPVFLGHQAREMVTHLVVTLPLATAACALVTSRRGDTSVNTVVALWKDRRLRLLGGAGLAISAFLVAAALTTGAASRGQTSSFTGLVWVHFFEHAMTYVVVTLAATSVAAWSRPVEPE